MRKVLLTTTALVALGGVSAASALDISGFQRFEYQSWDDTAAEAAGENDTQFSDYNRVVFSHEITGDNGMTASGYYRINNWAEAYHGIQVSTDLGSFAFGNWWTPSGFMYNSHLYNGTFRAATGQTFDSVDTSASAAILDGGDNSINYTNSVGGLTLMAALGDAGTESNADASEVYVAYAGDAGDMSFRIHGGLAASGDSTGQAGDEQDNSEYGISVDAGAIGVRMSRSEKTTTDATDAESAKVEANEYSVTYKASDDLTLGVIMLDSKDKLDTTNNPKLDMTLIAANYFIMPGLRVQASTSNFDYEGATDNDGSSVNLALRVDF